MNRKQLRAEIADWLVVDLIESEEIRRSAKFRPETVRPAEKLNFDIAFRRLIEKGCARKALLQVIGSATGISVAPLPSSSEVQLLARRMEILADDIDEVEKQPFLDVLDEVETQRLLREHYLWISPHFGPMLPFVHLPKYLRIRARMYREWARLCTLKVPPRRDLLERIARLYPLVYTEIATGGICSDQIAVVLKGAAISDASSGQLRRELAQFKKDCPHAYEDLVSRLRKIAYSNRLPD